MTTTIKVSDDLRDRLKEQAARDGLTLGAHLAHLADAEDRRRRLQSLKHAIERTAAADKQSHAAEAVASAGYLDAVTTLAIVLPITTTDRGWPNHVVVDGPSGLDLPSWIMTEQPRTLSRDRLTGTAGEVTEECLASVRAWLGDFLEL